MASVILACLFAVIAPHLRRLRHAVLPETAPHRLAPRLAAISTLVVAVWTGMSLAVHYVKKHPTPIDGTWGVVSQSGSFNGRGLQQVFFERNNAHAVIFRSPGGDVGHHFEIGADALFECGRRSVRKAP